MNGWRVLGSAVLALGLAAQAPRLERGASEAVSAAVPDDPELARVIAPLAAQIQASFGWVIAQAPQGLPRRAGATAATGAEVRLAFTNSGGVRRDLPAGPVHVGDLYEVVPFDNEMVVAEYTGAEVLAILGEGIRNRGGEPLSGARVEASGPLGALRVSAVWADGTAIDPAATYRIATSDYLLGNGDATPTLKRGRNVVLTSLPVRQLLIDWCERRGREGRPVEAPEGGRYRFTPELAEALKARRY